MLSSLDPKLFEPWKVSLRIEDKKFPQPDEGFHDLISKYTLPVSSNLRVETQQYFYSKLGLRIDNRKKSKEILYFLTNKNHDILDHCDCARYADRLIIISQPYNINMDNLNRLVNDYHLHCTIADEWAYYNPGNCHLIILEVTPVTEFLVKLERDDKGNSYRGPFFKK